MLNLNITIDGDKVLIEGLQRFGANINRPVRRGLERIGKGIFVEAFRWLQGPSRSQTRIFTKKEDYYKTGKRKRTSLKGRSESLLAAPGSYPVPRVTGHLLRMLNWLKPGETKTSGDMTFTASDTESIIYNAADYAENIFRGTGTSSKYGPRDALKDGLERFNQGGRIKQTIEEEITKDIKNAGLL